MLQFKEHIRGNVARTQGSLRLREYGTDQYCTFACSGAIASNQQIEIELTNSAPLIFNDIITTQQFYRLRIEKVIFIIIKSTTNTSMSADANLCPSYSLFMRTTFITRMRVTTALIIPLWFSASLITNTYLLTDIQLHEFLYLKFNMPALANQNTIFQKGEGIPIKVLDEIKTLQNINFLKGFGRIIEVDNTNTTNMYVDYYSGPGRLMAFADTIYTQLNLKVDSPPTVSLRSTMASRTYLFCLLESKGPLRFMTNITACTNLTFNFDEEVNIRFLQAQLPGNGLLIVNLDKKPSKNLKFLGMSNTLLDADLKIVGSELPFAISGDITTKLVCIMPKTPVKEIKVNDIIQTSMELALLRFIGINLSLNVQMITSLIATFVRDDQWLKFKTNLTGETLLDFSFVDFNKIKLISANLPTQTNLDFNFIDFNKIKLFSINAITNTDLDLDLKLPIIKPIIVNGPIQTFLTVDFSMNIPRTWNNTNIFNDYTTLQTLFYGGL